MRYLTVIILQFSFALIAYGQASNQESLEKKSFLTETRSGIVINRMSDERLKFLLEQDTVIRVSQKKDRALEVYPAYFVNDVHINQSLLKTIMPHNIESINVIKEDLTIKGQKHSGRIQIRLKEGFDVKPININDFIKKHIDLPSFNTIYMIDNSIVYDNYKKLSVNENGIYKIEVSFFENIQENLNLNIINLITRSEKNIKSSEAVTLGGD